MSISVVTVTWNSAETIGDLLAAVAGRHEIIVVDNGSSDDTPALVRRESRARLIEPGKNLGFGAGCNLGAQAATGDILIFLNPDTVPPERALESLAAGLADTRIGILMPALSASIRDVRETVGRFPSVRFVFLQTLGLWTLRKRLQVRAGRRLSVHWGFGACMAMRRSVFDEVGGFDSALFLYGEDMDLCRRVRDTGRSIVLDTQITVPHAGNHSGRQAFDAAARARLVLRSEYRFLETFHSARYARLTFGLRRVLVPLRALSRPDHSPLHQTLRDGSWRLAVPPSDELSTMRSAK